MNKKFLNAILFGALILGSAGTITSCKDYDDEIDDIYAKINNLGGLSDQLGSLTSQLTTAQSEAASAKTEASNALSTAQTALSKANEANDKAATAAAEAAVAKATADKAAADAKAAAIEAALAEVAKLQAQIDAAPKGLSDADIQKLTAQVDAATAKVTAILGHRLQSLAVIPTSHVNGIATIEVTSLKYYPQTYLDLSKEHNAANWGQTDGTYHTGVRAAGDYVRDHANKKDAKEMLISSKMNTAYYHVSPNNGVRNQDIKMPSFQVTGSTNVTRGVADDLLTENNPIKPTRYDIDKNVLKVWFEKTITGRIGNGGTKNHDKDEAEAFKVASLRVPISDDNLQADETEAYVNSEYTRIQENVYVPYIASTNTSWGLHKTEFADEVHPVPTGKEEEIGDDGVFVHYHDSVAVYDSKVNQYVDIKAQYGTKLNLLDWVTVCIADEDANDHSYHTNLANYPDYNLEFRFYKPLKPYITLGGAEGNSNATDQEQFFDVTEQGEMSSKVYTVNGLSATAVGREPIVRVELWDNRGTTDRKDDNLIAVRYIKVKWVQDTAKKVLPLLYGYDIYNCGSKDLWVDTETFNVSIYNKAQDGGMSKREFHANYLDGDFSGDYTLKSKTLKGAQYLDTTGDNPELAKYGRTNDVGVAVVVPNTEKDVDSYNIIWTITEKDIKLLYPNWTDKMNFYKLVTWKSDTRPTLYILLQYTIYMPDITFWGKDARYWKTDGTFKTFNVNPIVFDTNEANPAWGNNTKNNPSSNIYTDLLNGFLDDRGFKPTSGADGALRYKANTAANNDGLNFAYSTVYDFYRLLNTNSTSYVAPSKEWFYYSGAYGWAKGIPAYDAASRGNQRTVIKTLKKDPAANTVVLADANNYPAYEPEGVRFIFDEDKLNDADHTYWYYDKASNSYKKGYAYVMWKDAATHTTNMNPKSAGAVNSNDLQVPELWIRDITDGKSFNQKAATIVNYKPNNLQPTEMTYNLKLEESEYDHDPKAAWYNTGTAEGTPTEAAKALIGKNIPILMVADLCNDWNEGELNGRNTNVNYVNKDGHTDYTPSADNDPDIALNTTTYYKVVEQYDAYIIEPLKPRDAKLDPFTDATITGSTISILEANFYESWNADAKGNYYPVISPKADNLTDLKKYVKETLKLDEALAEELGYFYEAEKPYFETENVTINGVTMKVVKNIKTNLKLNTETGNLEPIADYKEGPFPGTTYIVVNDDNTELTYYNYSGTPVNQDYILYIPANYGYKWKTIVKDLVVTVKTNRGAEDHQK